MVVNELPSNAILGLDKDGNPTASSVVLPGAIKPNIKCVEEAIAYMRSNGPSIRLRTARFKYNLNSLEAWREASERPLCPGHVLQLYREGSEGRLTVPQGLNFPHTVNTSSAVRNVLFADQDLWDYDLSNAHYTILEYLCQREGLKTPCISHYNENKEEVRASLSDKYGIKSSALKTYLISWIYGSKDSPNGWNSMASKWGVSKLEEMHRDTLLRGLYREVVEGRRTIVKRLREGGKRIQNVLGKSRESGAPKNDLMFEMYGYEAWIMQILNEAVGDRMISMIYDGWVGKRMETRYLEGLVKIHTGIEIKIRGQKFESADFDLLR